MVAVAPAFSYNLALAAAGWVAYGATLVMFMIDGRPMWRAGRAGCR